MLQRVGLSGLELVLRFLGAHLERQFLCKLLSYYERVVLDV